MRLIITKRAGPAIAPAGIFTCLYLSLQLLTALYIGTPDNGCIPTKNTETAIHFFLRRAARLIGFACIFSSTTFAQAPDHASSAPMMHEPGPGGGPMFLHGVTLDEAQ